MNGFYDKVRILSEEEKQEAIKNVFSDEEWKKPAEVGDFCGEKGFSQSERIGARPALEVSGMLSWVYWRRRDNGKIAYFPNPAQTRSYQIIH